MRLTLTVLATFSLGAILAAADFTGTWKLNLEKSKLPPGLDVASETMTVSQIAPNAYTSTFDSVFKSGGKRHQEYNRLYDGKEHPLTGVLQEEGSSEMCEQITIPYVRSRAARRIGRFLE